MAYDKPKVQIDLDEYNDLKKQAESFSSNEYVVACKKIISNLIKTRFNLEAAVKMLEREGIVFYVIPNVRGEASYEDVVIDLTKK